MSASDVREAARAWLARDPDPDTRAELEGLLGGDGADPAAAGALADRFGERLQFGTAGLRGALGAGPNRMNRVVVQQAAAGLARYLRDTHPAAGDGELAVVVGYDARHKSDVFASDTARVLAAAGIRALVFPHVVPTPLLAFAIPYLGGAAGVQVTASHNPPADNGYKVYLGDGAQIVPPTDTAISTRIDAVAAAPDGPALAAPDHPLIEVVPAGVREAYVAGVLALDTRTAAPAVRPDLRIVHTAMHGVGGATVAEVLAKAGFSDVRVVAAQADPDPDFPTVAFPNPEEPGALDLAVAEARAAGADLILANDPDADRLAVAVPDPASPSGWRALRGDEVGWLLADHLLDATAALGPARLVVTTIVSSTLLRAMAADRGVTYVETLTGFKWLARAALARPELHNVLGYEEALGYSVGDLVRDKDGISAAVVFADLAAATKASGRTLLDRLSEISARYGEHRTEQWSIRLEGPGWVERMQALMARLRASLPSSLAGAPVTDVRDLAAEQPPADVVVLRLGDTARVVVRPSGTEPKCKVYFEVVEGTGAPPIPVLKAAVAELLGVDPG